MVLSRLRLPLRQKSRLRQMAAAAVCCEIAPAPSMRTVAQVLQRMTLRMPGSGPLSVRKLSIIVAAGALFISGWFCVQAQNAAPGKGKQIIDQAVSALGGDRFLNMRNRVAKGRIYSFFHDQLSGLDVTTTYTEYLPQIPKNGLGIREREVLGKKQDYSYLFLPDQAWDITFRGARPIEDEAWGRYVRTTENDIL